MYIYLNNKSGYSFLQSTLKIDDIIKYGIDNKMPYLSLTDHNNMFAVAEFVEKCQKNNIKPIIGMEINLKNSNTPLVLIASSNVGYLNLCKITTIVSKGSLDSQISIEDLSKYNEGLICILPYIRSHFYDLDNDKQVDFIAKLKVLFKAFYIGLEYYGSEDTSRLYKARSIATLTHSYSVPLVDVRTDNINNVEVLNVLRAIEVNDSISNLESINLNNHHFLNDSFIRNIYSDQEIYNSYNIASLCEYKFDDIKGKLVEYKVDDKYTQFEYLTALCQKGLAKRLNNNIPDFYKDRLTYELSIINKMGYVNYFLVVYDYVRFSKVNKIMVGPGRGSAGGSLVAYTLGITNIDPIKYDLLFERFLNPERISMPDIDVDFIDTRRDEVFKYLSEKYGPSRTARVIAFQTFKAKSALRDAAKALGASKGQMEELSNKLAKIKSDDLKELVEASPAFKSLIKTNDFYKKIYEMALRIEGLPRQTGMHAAGIIIANEDISSTVPVYYPNEFDSLMTTQFDLGYVEKFNLLKMDILGLTTLSVLENCKNLIKEFYGKDIDLDNIDLTDPNIYSIFNTGKLAGIFQMDQAGIGRAINIVKPTCFDDVVAVLALGRPGPNEFIPNYKNRKDGKEKINYIHPCLEEVLKPTYGVIVYQEQVMQILTKMAGFSLGKADTVRRAISKKDEEKLLKAKPEFIQGCLKNHISEKDANNTFDTILRFANYGFNKSHSVAYSVISCQTAYLKYYYPNVFYAAILNIIGDDGKFVSYINEMKSMGINIQKPSINKSDYDFSFDGKSVIFALTKIKEVTPISAKVILEERKHGLFKDFIDFVVRTYNKGLNIKVLTALIEAGCFDEFNISRATLKGNLENIMMYADVVAPTDGSQIIDELNLTSRPILTEYKDNYLEMLNEEKDRLAVYVSGFPLEKDREKFNSVGFETVDKMNEINKIYRTVLFINKVKPITTKKNTHMAILDCEDETGKITVTVFPEQYQQYENILRKDNFIQVKGKLEEREDKYQLIASTMKIYKLEGEE